MSLEGEILPVAHVTYMYISNIKGTGNLAWANIEHNLIQYILVTVYQDIHVHDMATITIKSVSIFIHTICSTIT